MRQEKETVDGVEYTFQSMPIYSFLQLEDRHRNKHGVIQQAPYMKELIEHVVIEPKVSINSFDDDYEGLTNLIQAIQRFLKSRRKPEQNKAESEE